jgi:hypothetical protein
MVTKPLSVEAALDARLSALAGSWIELRCPNHEGVVHYPVKLLREHYDDQRLGAILRRFRC